MTKPTVFKQYNEQKHHEFVCNGDEDLTEFLNELSTLRELSNEYNHRLKTLSESVGRNLGRKIIRLQQQNSDLDNAEEEVRKLFDDLHDLLTAATNSSTDLKAFKWQFEETIYKLTKPR